MHRLHSYCQGILLVGKRVSVNKSSQEAEQGLLCLAYVKHKRTMPPKKRTTSESEGPGPLLGRFGTSLKCGIVGLPNVG